MSLAALAVALIAARSNSSSSGDVTAAAITSAQALTIQNQLNFTRENEYEADRIGFQRLDAAGFDVGGGGDVDGAAAEGDAVRRRQRAVVPAHAPGHVRAHRRSAVARAERRRTGRSPTRSTSSWCARCCAATRASRRGGRVLRDRARRAQVQQRDRDALRARRVAAARRKDSRARSSELATLEQHRAAASDDRGDGRPRAARRRRAGQGGGALRGGARALPEQDAARLRLSRGAARAGKRRRRPRRSPRRSCSASPGRPLHRIAVAGLRRRRASG